VGHASPQLNFNYPEPTSLGYQAQRPFPHVVLKDAWRPDVLRQCKQAVESFADWDGGADTAVSRRKQTCGNIEAIPVVVKSVIDEASSPRFLRWLAALTGEPALLPDPYLEGGGVHRIFSGGFLKVHADFNWNRRIQVYRRLNLLLYLNPDWDEAWGGGLELWTQDLRTCEKVVFPHTNTMVIFTTDDNSYHGHPHQLQCPTEQRRDSIALYYYSPVKPKANFEGERTGTNWRPVGDDTFFDAHATMAQRAKRKFKSLFGT